MDDIFNYIKNKKGILLLLCGIILGVVLLITDIKEPQTTTSAKENETYTDNYTYYLEKKTEEMINKINGVSNANVMITLKNSGEQVFASDSSETNKKHVIVDDSLVCINEYMPEVEGVAVVCNGGDNAVIKQKITELLCSLLGIYSTHIYITE